MAGDIPSNVTSGKYVRQIVVTAPGPQGPSGLSLDEIPAAVSYAHTQSAANTEWVVTHNLDFYPNVTVFDSSGDMVEGTVTHTSQTSLTITFSSAISGKAYLS